MGTHRWEDHFLPLLIRALLLLLGAGALLQDRMELASPLSSMAAIRETLAQLRLGAADQPGGLAPLSPLLAPLALVPRQPFLPALPSLLADGISAWLLSSLAGPHAGKRELQVCHFIACEPKGPHLFAALLAIVIAVHCVTWRPGACTAGQAYLWSPFALLACLAGSTAPLHNALAIAAAWAAATGRPVLAGMALACAAELSVHTVLFTVSAWVLGSLDSKGCSKIHCW